MYIPKTDHDENIGHILYGAMLPRWSTMIDLFPGYFPMDDVKVIALRDWEITLNAQVKASVDEDLAYWRLLRGLFDEEIRIDQVEEDQICFQRVVMGGRMRGKLD